MSDLLKNNFRWVIIGLTFLITLISYWDRSAIAYAIGPLQRAFALDNAEFGWILGGFGFGYILMTVIGGKLCDRFGTKSIWSISVFLWSLVMICTSFANGFWSFFILRVLLGLAEGVQFPALARTTANWLKISERSRALALGLFGVPLASAIGAPLCTWLIVSFSWRIMFISLGCLGVLWSIAWLWLSDNLPKQSRFVSSKELSVIGRTHSPTAKPISWKKLLTNPSLMANNWAFFVLGYLIFFGISWLPGYLQQTFHTDLTQVGLFLILPWALGAVLLLFGGWLSDFFYRKTGSLRLSRSHLIWGCQLVSMLCFIPMIFSESEMRALVLISFGLAFGLMPNAMFFSLNIDLAKRSAGLSSGIMDSFFALAGILAPILTGELRHWMGNFSGAFALLALFTFTSVLGILFFQHPDRHKIA